jgi:hypothetical protein
VPNQAIIRAEKKRGTPTSNTQVIDTGIVRDAMFDCNLRSGFYEEGGTPHEKGHCACHGPTDVDVVIAGVFVHDIQRG